jgi:hypothetical protein
MTPQEQTELINEQHISGMLNGEATARIVNEQFPNGYPRELRREVRKITDAALAHVIDALKAGGVSVKYRAPFARGFRIGLCLTLRTA